MWYSSWRKPGETAPSADLGGSSKYSMRTLKTEVDGFNVNVSWTWFTRSHGFQHFCFFYFRRPRCRCYCLPLLLPAAACCCRCLLPAAACCCPASRSFCHDASPRLGRCCADHRCRGRRGSSAYAHVDAGLTIYRRRCCLLPSSPPLPPPFPFTGSAASAYQASIRR